MLCGGLVGNHFLDAGQHLQYLGRTSRTQLGGLLPLHQLSQEPADTTLVTGCPFKSNYWKDFTPYLFSPSAHITPNRRQCIWLPASENLYRCFHVYRGWPGFEIYGSAVFVDGV